MTPTRSPNKNSCVKSSSNCVDWEGGLLDGIGLCQGDSISDVTQKLNKAIQILKADINLSELELKCLVNDCLACPKPAKTLQNVLQLLINKVCSLTTVNSVAGTLDEKILTLSSCFLGTSTSEGDPITKLPHSDYTKRIASKVCDLASQLSGLSQDIEDIDSRLNTVENKITTLGKKPKVTPKCVFPNNQLQDIDVAWEALEDSFCSIKSILGEPTVLSQAISRQNPNIDAAPALGASGTMASIQGWKTKASNVGDTIGNILLTLNDVRGAVKAIQDNCCKVNCDSVKVDFDIRLSDDRQIATLFFATKSKLPVGFTDCNELGNTLQIMDGAGNTYDTLIKVVNAARDIDGIQIDLSATPIDPSLDYTFTITACMTNGDLTCSKCVTKTATYKDTCAYCEFTATGAGSADGQASIVYEEGGTRKVLSLLAGETKVLKKNIKIISVAREGSINVTSSCPSNQAALSNIEDYVCIKVDYAQGLDQGGSGAWSDGDTAAVAIGYLDQIVSIEPVDVNNPTTTADRIKQAAPKGMIIYAKGFSLGHVGDRDEKRIALKVPKSIADTVFIKFNISSYGPTRVYGTTCTDCCPAISTSLQ